MTARHASPGPGGDAEQARRTVAAAYEVGRVPWRHARVLLAWAELLGQEPSVARGRVGVDDELGG